MTITLNELKHLINQPGLKRSLRAQRQKKHSSPTLRLNKYSPEINRTSKKGRKRNAFQS